MELPVFLTVSTTGSVHYKESNTLTKTTGGLYACIEKLNKAADYTAGYQHYRRLVLSRCRYT
jgi:hypothetical protein